MILTKELKRLLIIIMIVTAILDLTGRYALYVESYLLMGLVGPLNSLLFWGAVVYTTKDFKNGLISFIIINLLTIFWHLELDLSQFQLYFFSYFIPIPVFMYFGFTYFKNMKGLWLGLVGVVFSLLLMFFPGSSFVNFWNNIFGFFGYSELFIFHIDYFSIDFLYLLFNSFYEAFLFLIFWLLFNKIKGSNKRSFDYKFTRLMLLKTYEVGLFSLVFWSFRIVIICFLIANFSVISTLEAELFSILKVLSFFLTIYLLSSVYRNFLTSYFIANGHKIGWMYYWLNVPFINLFAWLVFVSRGSEKKVVNNPDLIDDQAVVSIDSEKDNFVLAQAEFKKSNKNKNIQNLLLVFAFISPLYTVGMMLFYNRFSMFTPLVISFFVSLLTLLYFLSDKKAVYYIYIGQVLLVFLVGFFAKEYFQQVFFIGTVMNFIIYYPLFHLDQFTVSKDLETELKNNNENDGKSFLSRLSDDFMKFDD